MSSSSSPGSPSRVEPRSYLDYDEPRGVRFSKNDNSLSTSAILRSSGVRSSSEGKGNIRSSLRSSNEIRRSIAPLYDDYREKREFYDPHDKGRSSNTSVGTSDAAQHSTLLHLAQKLKERSIKPATVIHKCELLDRNKDDLLHINDLQAVLNDLLGERDSMTQREMHHLNACIGTDKGHGIIAYKDLFDLLDDKTRNLRLSSSSRDGGVYEAIEKTRAYDDKWAYQRGSIGEWLLNEACPAEIQNFKRLISCLEDFERKSGMKCEKTPVGFELPLGPNLSATIQLHAT